MTNKSFNIEITYMIEGIVNSILLENIDFSDEKEKYKIVNDKAHQLIQLGAESIVVREILIYKVL